MRDKILKFQIPKFQFSDDWDISLSLPGHMSLVTGHYLLTAGEGKAKIAIAIARLVRIDRSASSIKDAEVHQLAGRSVAFTFAFFHLGISGVINKFGLRHPLVLICGGNPLQKKASSLCLFRRNTSLDIFTLAENIYKISLTEKFYIQISKTAYAKATADKFQSFSSLLIWLFLICFPGHLLLVTGHSY